MGFMVRGAGGNRNPPFSKTVEGVLAGPWRQFLLLLTDQLGRSRSSVQIQKVPVF